MVVMHHAKPNKLQCHALLLADKVCIQAASHTCMHTRTGDVICKFQISTLSEHNEELMKLKHAGPWSKILGKVYGVVITGFCV